MTRVFRLLVAAILLCTIAAPAFADETLTVYNWQDYIDREVLDLFTQETGIAIDYPCFTTNEDMYVKVKTAGESYDVLFPSDYMIERLIREDRLEKLNFDNMPNAQNVLSNLRNAAYDPTMEYSVPYMWGTVGILYNKDMVTEPVTSWSALWDDRYVNNVFMIDSFRDTLGVTLKSLGYSMNTREPAELEAARDKLIDQKKRGIVKAYQVDETKDKMIAGEAALALMWSGDAQYAMNESESLEYVIPEEGTNIWVDCMVVMKGSEHKEAAEKFIDFLCRPEIAKMNMDEIGYCTPIQQVKDGMTDEQKASAAMNPAEDMLAKCEYFHDVSDAADVYDRIWMSVKAAR